MTRAKIAPPDGRAIAWTGNAAIHDDALVLIIHWRKMPANDAFVPAGVVPALVVAAIGAEHFPGQAFFGRHDAVRRAVGRFGRAASRSFGRPGDISLASRDVSVVIVCSLVAARRHANGRRGNIAPILVHLALIEPGAACVIAAPKLARRIA